MARILYIDIDSLRPDHLSCYGYHRKTSPNIDKVASNGVIFENCFVSDAPCLPSRSSFFSGRFGIHTGVVNHAGTNADPIPEGKNRSFQTLEEFDSFPMVLKKGGINTVSISPFAERHSAWWFYSGFREIYNSGKDGIENADEIFPYVLHWLERYGKSDDWFLHVNFWDPHTPYDHPDEFGNPFINDPPPTWITEDIIKSHYESYGPHSAHEVRGFGYKDYGNIAWWGIIPNEIKAISDYKKWIDGYDTGIKYTDYYVGKILDLLKRHKIFDETIIIITSDHGENQGELNVYGDHQTADYITSRVPFIIKWPGITRQKIDKGLHYQTDIGATILELLNLKVPKLWDGVGFANKFKNNKEYSRDYLVVSQCAWSCQRAVVFKEFILIKTYHTGLKNFPEIMLFNIKEDPHETKNIVKENSNITGEGLKLLDEWTKFMMTTSITKIDPLDIVLEEGGPCYTREELERYCKRLQETDRAHHARILKEYRGKPIKK